MPAQEKTMTTLEEQLLKLRATSKALVARLDNGTEMIERIRDAGQDVSKLETFWITLLRQYERTEDEIKAICAKIRQPEPSPYKKVTWEELERMP
jgi:hypothetical protein